MRRGSRLSWELNSLEQDARGREEENRVRVRVANVQVPRMWDGGKKGLQVSHAPITAAPLPLFPLLSCWGGGHQATIREKEKSRLTARLVSEQNLTRP